MPFNFKLRLPRGFNFAAAVRGHGWYDLAPFRFDAENMRLVYVFRDARGRPLQVEMAPGRGQMGIELDRKIARVDSIEGAIRHVLRMDEDLSEFYGLTRASRSFEWVAKQGAGRLLRSQTVFEDLVKTICTTNCSWSLTRSMVSNLVTELGEVAPSGAKSFPTPEAIAERGEKFFREVIRAGYRSTYFPMLAKDVVAGRLDPESWLDPSIPIAELKKEIKSVKGVGDYAAENLLKLLGRYEGLALDSWLRAGFAKKHNGGRKCPDSKIEKFYASFGKWKGLAIWCDMTEHWY